MKGIRKNEALKADKQSPGCLARMANLFDLSAGVSANRLLTDKPHCDGWTSIFSPPSYLIDFKVSFILWLRFTTLWLILQRRSRWFSCCCVETNACSRFLNEHCMIYLMVNFFRFWISSSLLVFWPSLSFEPFFTWSAKLSSAILICLVLARKRPSTPFTCIFLAAKSLRLCFLAVKSPLVLMDGAQKHRYESI